MSNSTFGGSGDPDLIDLVSEDEDDPSVGDYASKDLEAFLDNALKGDPVLRGILEEGMTSIIKATFRLLTLTQQRGMRRGSGQGSQAGEKGPYKKPLEQKSLETDEESPFVASKGQEGSNPEGPSPSLTLTSHTDNEGLEQDDGPVVGLEEPRNLCEEEDEGIKGRESPSGKRRGRKRGPFPSTSRLEEQLRTHVKKKSFPCNLCGKELAHKSTLEVHIRYHLKEKWYKCPHQGCSSSFVTGYELKVHSRVHSGEKPFICNFCGKGFSQKGDLNGHIRRHVKEKPFKCPQDECRFSFVTAGELRVHSSVHSGEKPFACPHPGCGKTFSQNSRLNRHMTTHGVKGDSAGPLTKKRKIENVC